MPCRLGVEDADGATVAEDATAPDPLPLFDNSAMDGYAVRAADAAAARATAPVIVPVEAEVAAGDSRELKLATGTCARIMTGAPMPAGADAVVRIEWTDGRTMKVAIGQAIPSGCAGQRGGSEAGRGQVLLAAGHRSDQLRSGCWPPLAAAASWPGPARG